MLQTMLPVWVLLPGVPPLMWLPPAGLECLGSEIVAPFSVNQVLTQHLPLDLLVAQPQLCDGFSCSIVPALQLEAGRLSV